MTPTIRSRRRNRWRHRAHLRRLDQLAMARIRRNYLLSAASWGGQYCPDCGANIRPHWLVDFSGAIGGGYVDGFMALSLR